MSNPVQQLIDFATRFEPKDGYWGPESLVDILAEDPEALNEFRAIFDGANAEQLDDLEDQEKYGWIVAGAADELDLLPDDPRLFKSADELAGLEESEMLGELGAACIVNDVNAVQYLSERIDVNQVDHHGQLPLGYAVGNNHLECTKALLANGADPNRAGNFRNTAMHICATTIASQSVWKLLLKHGGIPESKNDDGKTAIQLVKETGRSHWLA